MTLPLTLALLAIFASVAVAVAYLASQLLERQSVGQRRFREALESVRPRAAAVTGSVVGVEGLPSSVQSLSKFLPKSPKEMTKLQRRMAVAGIHSPKALIAYLLGEVGGAIVGFMIPVQFLGWSRGLIFGAMGAIVGYITPSFILGYLIAKRQKQIGNGLPDALDLLIVCLEAGLGIDQAIVKTGDELALAYPALSEELKMINVEGRAGKPRIEAFKNFATRTKVDDVRALVAMLIQTDRFGTSVAQALRTHAEVSRTKRRQRAEEKAAKVGVKLVFPLVFCLFPAFYVVTLGPAIVKFVHALGPGGALSGGR